MKHKILVVTVIMMTLILSVLSVFQAFAEKNSPQSQWESAHNRLKYAVKNSVQSSSAVAPKIYPYEIADVNLDGEISVADVEQILRYLTMQAELSDEQITLADTDYDGKITVNDATMVQKMISKLYVPLTGKKGVDISSNNGDVDMQKIKDAGYDFVIIRCGFGDDYTSQDDNQFESNVAKCEKLGIPWGVYIYSYALTKAEAESEAAHVLRLLKGKKPTLPVVFDMEDGDGYKQRYGMPSNSMLVTICKTFLSKVESAGYYTMLYANLDWINNRLNDESLLNSTDIWLAQWNTTCDYRKSNVGMWQYGGEVNFLESNYIDGVGVVDKNFCFKDYPAIIKAGHYNGW